MAVVCGVTMDMNVLYRPCIAPGVAGTQPRLPMATHAQLVCDLYDSLKARGIQFDGAWLSDKS